MQSQSLRYIVDENGKKISVVLPISEYQRMQEDLHDLLIIIEGRCEKTVAVAQMRKILERRDINDPDIGDSV